MVAILVIGLDSRLPLVVVGAPIAGVEADVIEEVRFGTLGSMTWLPLPALTSRSTDNRGGRMGDAGIHIVPDILEDHSLDVRLDPRTTGAVSCCGCCCRRTMIMRLVMSALRELKWGCRKPATRIFEPRP